MSASAAISRCAVVRCALCLLLWTERLCTTRHARRRGTRTRLALLAWRLGAWPGATRRAPGTGSHRGFFLIKVYIKRDTRGPRPRAFAAVFFYVVFWGGGRGGLLAAYAHIVKTLCEKHETPCTSVHLLHTSTPQLLGYYGLRATASGGAEQPPVGTH
jgi:hypothetical protein